MRGVPLEKATCIVRATATYGAETSTDEAAYDLCCASCTLEAWMSDDATDLFMQHAIDSITIEILPPATNQED